jgi:hypothetical protein
MSFAERYVPTKAIRDAVAGREAEVLDALGIFWNGKSHIRCPYPDHEDQNPSWRWDPVKRRAHCTCTRSASIFDVVAKVKGIDFEAAKIWIAESIGRPDLIRQRGGKTKATGKRKGRGRNSSGDNTATVQHPAPGCTLAAYAAAKHLPVEFLRSLGITEITLFGKPAIRIPYFDGSGGEAAVRFRIALDTKDRFRWRKGSKARLYGLNRLGAGRDLGEIVIVEGESDCHTLWHSGFPAIGLPGNTTWNEARDVAVLAEIARIYIVIEPGDSGKQVMTWIAKSKIKDRVKLVRLDGFKDPSELYVDDPGRFAERWREALAAAVPWREEASREAHAARTAAWSRCAELARCPNILAKALEAVRACGLIGEERAVKLIYLAMTSRLLARIVSIAVKGPSSGGKSFLVEIILKLFPSEALYVLTAMSERALAYGEEPLAHRIMVLYEAAGMASDFGTYLIRSLLSEGRICYETVEKTEEGLKSRRIEREGPTGLITTTTAVRLHPENETRLLSLTVTDTPQQTKAIMRAQAGRQGHTNKPDLTPWLALQQFLALGAAHVVIPFASELADLIPAVAVRLRRDFPTVLALIEAHALLHQATRERTPEGAVIATLEDYSTVREIVIDFISQGVDVTVPKIVRDAVTAVTELATEDGCGGVSLTKLAKKLGLDKSSTSRRATDAIARGYLKNLEENKGRSARLVIGDPLPADVEVLPTVPTLRERCCVALLQGGIEPSAFPAAAAVANPIELAEADV